MRNTSEASRALLRSRTVSEMVQVQVAFVHDNMQSFLDQSARLTETGSRIVTRPFEVLREERRAVLKPASRRLTADYRRRDGGAAGDS